MNAFSALQIQLGGRENRDGEGHFSPEVNLTLKYRVWRCQLSRFMFPLNGTGDDRC